MYLPFIKEYFLPKSILDVGAHIGSFYEAAVQQFPDAYFYLIEANPACEEHLKKLKVDYYIGPVSDSIKEVNFYTTIDDVYTTGASIYRENTHHFSDEKLITSKYITTTLDVLFLDKQFDLIKLDVQGSELDILRGGSQTISKSKGLVIELSLTQYNRDAPLEADVINHLRDIGFVEVEELGSNYTRDHMLFQRDALFINTNL